MTWIDAEPDTVATVDLALLSTPSTAAYRSLRSVRLALRSVVMVFVIWVVLKKDRGQGG